MRYTEIAKATPFEGAPKINLPDCYAASPNKPILLRIPVIGSRPITYKAENLPAGLTLDNGIIKGEVKEEGVYNITIIAENSHGKATKNLSLEIKKDTVLLTPLMGFTSWNAFDFRVSQEKMEMAAEKIANLGINEYGYSYINIDSGWQGEYGGKFDAIQPNEKFSDIKGFVDKMHALGFKCGIYSTPMLYAFGCSMEYIPLPPGCTQGEPDPRFADERGGIGVIRKEKNNALQWAEWGFDYLKYDWRPSDPVNAELMRQELVSTDRDFGFCVTVKARPEYHTYWEKYCNSYRCNSDSVGNWDNLVETYKSYFDFIDYVNKGHFFDLDMLDLGDCDLFELLGYVNEDNFGLSEDEQIVAYSMRAFLNSPLQISTNFKNFSEFEMSVYCNEEIIAINQDSLCDAAKPYLMIENSDKIFHVLKKKLSDGNFALALFNLGKTEINEKIYLDEVSHVRDLWAKKDLPDTKTLSVDMKPHTVKILKIGKA